MSGPLILLADSQLLFAGAHSSLFLAWLRSEVQGRRGVYLGASNGDVEDFYLMARDAFSALGAPLHWQSMHDTALSPDYDFYVLAGGDVAQGWGYLGDKTVRVALQTARDRGALFLGVSAGAMHLASAYTEGGVQPQCFLGWLDVVVAVHEEHQHWPTRQHWQGTGSTNLPLLCIPMGGGLVWVNGQRYPAGNGVQWHEPDGDE